MALSGCCLRPEVFALAGCSPLAGLPLGLCGVGAVVGAIFGFYPYPFIDVTALGYPQVLLNSFVLAIGFLVMGLLLVIGDRGLKKSCRLTYRIGLLQSELITIAL